MGVTRYCGCETHQAAKVCRPPRTLCKAGICRNWDCPRFHTGWSLAVGEKQNGARLNFHTPPFAQDKLMRVTLCSLAMFADGALVLGGSHDCERSRLGEP